MFSKIFAWPVVMNSIHMRKAFTIAKNILIGLLFCIMIPICVYADENAERHLQDRLEATTKTPSYDSGIYLGMGSGTLTYKEICDQAKGRVPVVIAGGDPRGRLIDFLKAANQIAGFGENRVLPLNVGVSIHHSMGSQNKELRADKVIQLDSVATGLHSNEIRIRGIVTDLTKPLDLKTPLVFQMYGVTFSGHWDYFTPYERVEDTLRFTLALLTLPSRGAMELFGMDGFPDHAIRPMLETLEASGEISPKNTYKDIQIIYLGSNGIRRIDFVRLEKDGDWKLYDQATVEDRQKFHDALAKSRLDDMKKLNTSGLPPPPPPGAEALPVEIRQAIDRGDIEVEAEGTGNRSSLKLKIKNKTKDWMLVGIPEGTTFNANSFNVQNMAIRKP